MLAPSPMDSFNIGKQIGTANSPFSGLKDVIESLVETAKKKGLLQAGQDIKTQGAVDVAQATQPFERENLQFASDLKTEQATAEAGAMEQFKIKAGERGTEQAIATAEGTQPFAEKTSVAQSREQGNQARLTARETARLKPTKTKQGYIVTQSGETVPVTTPEGQTEFPEGTQFIKPSESKGGFADVIALKESLEAQGDPIPTGTPEFSTEADMDAAIQRGEIRVGDPVIVGGVSGRAG